MKRLYILVEICVIKLLERHDRKVVPFFMYMVCNYSEDVKTKSIASLQIIYKCGHSFSIGLYLLKIPQLISCADEVVLWILDFIVGVSVEIVCKEAHGLHHGKQSYSERQMFALYRREETCR